MATKKITTTKKAPKPSTPKAKMAKPAAKTLAKKLSQIDAAIRVLADAGEPMSCKAMVEAMTGQGLLVEPQRQDAGSRPCTLRFSATLAKARTPGS